MIVIVAFVVILLLFVFIFFMNSTRSNVYTTKKLGEAMLARELANSLAILANHYIKCDLLVPGDSDLRNELSKPYEKMEESYSSGVGFNEGFKEYLRTEIKSNNSESIIDILENNGEEKEEEGVIPGLRGLYWEVGWRLCREDFSPVMIEGKTPYPREKTGFLRITVYVEYFPPGTGGDDKQKDDKVIEYYEFYSRINVLANLLPVLSKFSLYVEDALDGEDVGRFNVVSTNDDGNLNQGTKFIPWVLKNGDTSLSSSGDFQDLISSPRGLVYLGGGTAEKGIELGIARGQAESGHGDYGEDFHFFKNQNEEDGYWKILKSFKESDETGVLVSEIGLCDDDESDDSVEWQEELKDNEKIDKDSRVNSILKLYGTDGDKSPTLVFGYVKSKFASIRIFKGSEGVNFLSNFGENNYENESRYLEATQGYEGGDVSEENEEDANDDSRDISLFYQAINKENNDSNGLSYDDYHEKWASQLVVTNYNKGLAYISTNNIVDHPIERGSISDEKLKSLYTDQSTNAIFTNVPGGFNEIYAETDLQDLSKFIDVEKLSISTDVDSFSPGVRIGDVVKVSNSEDFEKFLTGKGYLKDGNLNLNCWIYVKSTCSEITINKCTISSHGGIIVDNGDVCIKGDIKAEVSNSVLTVLALTGNISIESGVAVVDASLVAAGGQVKLIGGTRPLEVNGNIVMKKIERGSIENYMSRGLKLNYMDQLSAMPNKEEDEGSELPLLMFDIKNSLNLVD